jgi:predicted SAM-dependent methyltransferase
MKKYLLFLFSHRTLALLKWDLYFIRIRLSNFLFNKKRKLSRLLKLSSGKKMLNLGSGPRGIDNESWINIDGFIDKNVQYVCDFTKKLPFDAETFDGIFCEHVLEHFDYQNGKNMVRECYRIMKNGGIIRIIIPDGQKILKAYFENPDFIIAYKQCEHKFPMEAVNKWFYQRYEHQCIYDAPYLMDMLKSIGYKNPVQQSFLNTSLANNELLLDDEKYKWESLYIEAEN